MTRHTFVQYALLLGSLTMLGPLAVDTFSPAMVSVAQGLDTSRASVQFSLSAMFFGGAIGQLIYGPLSDRFGRKPVILGALSVYLLAIFGAILSPDVDTFSGWRFLQGLAGASGRILAGAVARDLLDKDKLSQMISAATFVGAAITIAAPVMGGYLAGNFPWESVFYLMAAVTAVIIVSVALFLDESLAAEHRQPLRPATILHNFLEITRHRLTVYYVLCGGFALSGISAFISAGAFVLMGTFGLQEELFGIIFASVSVGFSAGTGVTAALIPRVGSNMMIKIGAAIMTTGGITLAALAIFDVAYVLAVMAPMVVFTVGFSIVVPLATAGALSQFPEIAGTTSSYNGFIGNLMVAVMAAALGAFGGGTQLSLGLAVGISAILSAATYLFFIYPREPAR